MNNPTSDDLRDEVMISLGIIGGQVNVWANNPEGLVDSILNLVERARREATLEVIDRLDSVIDQSRSTEQIALHNLHYKIAQIRKELDHE